MEMLIDALAVFGGVCAVVIIGAAVGIWVGKHV